MSLEIAKTHYIALRKYLASHLIKEQLGISAQRQSARDKLVRLTQQQFQELSTDVYDELCRRLLNSPTVPFLPLKTEYHPKRNQARQKLATLPKARFKDLASDVFAELSRRYPQFGKEWEVLLAHDAAQQAAAAGEDMAPLSPLDGSSTVSASASMTTLGSSSSGAAPPRKAPPIPASASSRNGPSFDDKPPSNGPKRIEQSPIAPKHAPVPSPHPHETMIIPMQAQAVLVAPGEEGLNYTVHDGRGGEVEYGNGMPLERKESSGSAVGSNPADIMRFQEYEREIRSMRERVRDLESKLASKNDRADSSQVQELRSLLRDQEEINRDLESRFNELKHDYRDLQQEHRQCGGHKGSNGSNGSNHGSAREVASLLETIEELARRNEELEEFRNGVNDRLHTLSDENKQLSRTVEEQRRELRALRGTSEYVRNNPKAEFDEDGENLLEPVNGGRLELRHVTGYQLAVDTLLRAARSETPTRVLMVMKDVVISCKDLTAVMQRCQSESDEDDFVEQLDLLKSQLSQSLGELVAAAKSHATGFGVSPVGTVETAVMVLTEVVVETVRLLRIQPDNHANGLLNDGKRSNRRSASADQVDAGANGGHARSVESLSNHDVEELKIYLEQRADAIVQAIQDLVGSMRAPTVDAVDLVENLGTINDIVRNLVKRARRTLDGKAGQAYRAQGNEILYNLEESNSHLEHLKDRFPMHGDVQTSGADGTPGKQELAGVSFELAKYTKELIALID